MIEWNDSLAIGDRRIDGQHQELISLLSEFQTQRVAGAGDADLHRKLEEVALYARYHFYCEEGLMTEIGFPEIDAHTSRHHILLEILDHIVKDLDTGKYPPSQIEGFLVQWFMDHLVDEDSKIREFIRPKTEQMR